MVRPVLKFDNRSTEMEIKALKLSSDAKGNGSFSQDVERRINQLDLQSKVESQCHLDLVNNFKSHFFNPTFSKIIKS